MAATLVSTTESITTGSSTLTVDLPATYNSGDLLVMSVAQVQAVSLPAHTLPTGWSEVFTTNEIDQDNFQMTHNVWYRVADGGEGSSVSVTSNDNGRSVHQVFRITGHGSSIDDADYTWQQFSATPSAPSITTTADDELVITILAQSAPPDPFNPTVPTSTTLAADNNNSNQVAMASAYYTQASAGATGSVSWSDGDAADVSDVVQFAITTASASAPTFENAFVGTNGDWLRLSASEALSLGAGGSTGIVVTASGGDVTASYCAGGSTTTELVYPMSRRIGKNEVVTYGYTNPGDGWESTAGDDVANVTAGASVTNNSTTMAHSNLIGLYLVRRRTDPKIRM